MCTLWSYQNLFLFIRAEYLRKKLSKIHDERTSKKTKLEKALQTLEDLQRTQLQ